MYPVRVRFNVPGDMLGHRGENFYKTMTHQLPIEQIRTALVESLQHCPRAIVTADPGSGKSTSLPLFFLQTHRRIIVAQPRRIAARSLAEYVASLRNESPGQSIGYRVRYDTRTSSETGLEYVTDGMLVRLLQADPELTGVKMVILDEFHERSVYLDLALTLLMELQSALRPDLKIIIMSATLDTVKLSDWCQAPHFHAPGLIFPNEIIYTASSVSMSELTAKTTAQALTVLKDPETKNCLVFLPSVRLIHAVHRALAQRTKVRISLLYGQQSLTAQSDVLSTQGQHLILATNIAETSLTIPGVNRVIDTGWRREARYVRPWVSNALFDTRIAKFSARQRAGRANRNGPGKVYRLWTEYEYQGMVSEDLPQISTTNLEQLYLECLYWGAQPKSLNWLTQPPEVALDDARRLLVRLGALEGDKLSPAGHSWHKSQLSPRGQKVLALARDLGHDDKLRIAYILPLMDGERLPSKTDGPLEHRLKSLGSQHAYLKTVKRIAGQLSLRANDVKCPHTLFNQPVLESLLAGFPERLAQQRPDSRKLYLMGNGCGAKIHARLDTSAPKYCLALSVGGVKTTELTLFDVAECEIQWIPTQQRDDLYFARSEEKVVCRRRTVFGQLVLSDTSAQLTKDTDAVTACLVDAVLDSSTPVFTQTDKFDQLCARIKLINQSRHSVDLPIPLGRPGAPMDRDELRGLCSGKRSFQQLSRVDLCAHYLGALSYHQRHDLDRLTPPMIQIENGQSLKLRYDLELGPVLSTRFEWLFGVTQTPHILDAPVLLELLAPNMRPIQVTRDLKSFWSTGYPEVRKTLRGRYPKHPWPQDPVTAGPGVGRRKRIKK